MDFIFDHLEIVAVVLYFAIFFISKIFMGAKSVDDIQPRAKIPSKKIEKNFSDDDGALSRKYSDKSDGGSFSGEADRDIASRYGDDAEGKFSDVEEETEEYRPKPSEKQLAEMPAAQTDDIATMFDAEKFAHNEPLPRQEHREHTKPNPPEPKQEPESDANNAATVRKLLGSVGALKRAFIVSEIVDKPKSLKNADRII